MKKRSSKEILAATLLELAEKLPVNKITVKLITEQSGLAQKTFYNHFRDKYMLMQYIIDSETARLHAKIQLSEYSYHSYLIDAVSFYKSVRSFLLNAINNTSGQYAYAKSHAESAYEALLAFILKRNCLDSVPQDIQFALRLYSYGLVNMFIYHYVNNNGMDAEIFARSCEAAVPNILKTYLQ